MRLCRHMLPVILLLLVLCLAGCGEDVARDIQTEYEGLVFSEVPEDGILLGIQYFGRKEILLWANEERTVFLSEEGKGTEKILLRDVEDTLIRSANKWWLDETGRFFILQQNNITVLDQTGMEICQVTAEGNINDICSTPNGKIVLKIDSEEGLGTSLSVLDVDGGKIAKKLSLKNGAFSIAQGYQKDILLADMEGVCDLDLKKEDREWYMKWKGSSYSPDSMIMDIRLISENQIIFLKENKFAETLKYIAPDTSGKAILKYRSTAVSEAVKELIVRFNQENTDYYIVVEECPEGMDYNAFQEKTDMEIAAGYGPDIVCSSAVNNIYSLLTKGAFEDLSPYMETKGIQKEEYFPAAFETWRIDGSVYGVGTQMSINTVCMDSALVNKGGDLNIVSLLELLGQCSETDVFIDQYQAEDLLNYFLLMSEDLWGIVDWENSTCDFNGELWKDMLRIAKIYAADNSKSREDSLAVWLFWGSFPLYSAYDNALTAKGMEPVGYPEGEGMALSMTASISAVNSNSKQKEGAWEFLTFLLEDESQERLCKGLGFPVKKAVFDQCAAQAREHPEPTSFMGGGLEGSTQGITAEQTAALTEHISRARVRPLRTEPILKIIAEEAQEYFSGVKNMEEVSSVIQNRVQLYLDENS